MTKVTGWASAWASAPYWMSVRIGFRRSVMSMISGPGLVAVSVMDIVSAPHISAGALLRVQASRTIGRVFRKWTPLTIRPSGHHLLWKCGIAGFIASQSRDDEGEVKE